MPTRQWVPMRAWIWFALTLLIAAGCTRSHYRNAADRESYPIIGEREALNPGFDIGRIQLEPRPGSRLGDPFDPDHPPKPPDDPAAAVFMARPGGMRGARGWGKDGYTDLIEPPGWEQALCLDQGGFLRLDQQRSTEMGLLNSREYQTALEEVYLSALALTLNRFEFQLHWFGRNATNYTHFGSGGRDGGETSTLTSITDFGFTRNFAAGGQLLVDFANSLMFEHFNGTNVVKSNLLITLTQPLLRNFGRKVRLESLTQAERDTLYAVRVFARFRKQFWANVAVQSGGYLDLLLALQTLRNTEANLKRQEETYRLYDELFRGGRASVVELDQFYLSMQSARQSVIDARVALETAQDSFKLRLGIPPRIPVELDDAPLNPFVLTDPKLEAVRDELEAFQRARFAELDAAPTAENLRRYFVTLRDIVGRVESGSALAAADMERWRKRLDRPQRPGDDPEQRARERSTYDSLRKVLPETADDLKKAVALIDQHAKAVAEGNRKESWEAVTQDAKNVLTVLDGVVAVQTQARIHLIELPEVEWTEADGLAYAHENRLDLMNRLGAATDAWRKVTVAANALRGDVNVVTAMNLGTDPDHKRPFNFAAEASSYAVGLQLDAPLNRLAERNAYRASLITYQRAKRAYVDLSDNVEFQVRRDLRQLNRLRIGFEIARQQLLSAARQYENARLILLGPRNQRTANDTTTLNLLQALSSLLAARNALVASYINFEQQRVQLLLDLEYLQLDHEGFPINASPRSAAAASPDRGQPGPAPGPAAEPLPPPRPVGP
jgi:outer membrane protein TolC